MDCLTLKSPSKCCKNWTEKRNTHLLSVTSLLVNTESILDKYVCMRLRAPYWMLFHSLPRQHWKDITGGYLSWILFLSVLNLECTFLWHWCIFALCWKLNPVPIANSRVEFSNKSKIQWTPGTIKAQLTISIDVSH